MGRETKDLTEADVEFLSNSENFRDDEESMDYQAHAEAVRRRLNINLRVKFLRHGYMDFDTAKKGEGRDIFTCTITRVGSHVHLSTPFGQSIHSSTGDGGDPPDFYTVMSCLERYPAEDFPDWAYEYGYELTPPATYRQAHRTWEACRKQWNTLKKMFNERELEVLRSIQ